MADDHVVEPTDQAQVLPFWIDAEQSQLPLDKGWLLQMLRSSRSELARLKILHYMTKGGTAPGGSPPLQEVAKDIAEVVAQIDTLCVIAEDMIASGEPIPLPSKLEVAAREIVEPPPRVRA